jgi:hypothetical protein
MKNVGHTLPGLFKGDPNFENPQYRDHYEWLIKGKTGVRRNQ